ncbi:MAG: AsmA-like C-terminal region-containing protein [Rhodospirillales bacterium]
MIDQTGPAPSLALRADLTGATPDDLPVLPPLAFAGGTIDLGADVSASGYSPAALLATASGEIHARLHDTALAGVDLPQLTRLLAARAPGLRPALTAAMGAGNTGPLSGDISASLQQGAATLPRAHVAGGAGSLAIEGSIDLPGRTSDLALQVAPAVTDPPALGLRLVGPWQGGKRVADVRPALLWAGVGPAKKARGSAPGPRRGQ